MGKIQGFAGSFPRRKRRFFSAFQLICFMLYMTTQCVPIVIIALGVNNCEVEEFGGYRSVY
jgi:hypothetical protein